MEYYREIQLKDGRTCCLRNGTEQDGAAVLAYFNQTHGETDFLLTYPDENSFDAAQEAAFLREKAKSEDEIEIVAVVDGVIAGSAGIEAIGRKFKVQHRADFGISILREYWGLGIGQALLQASIECAENAGYAQLELTVVADNVRALTMYRKAGFVELGRNPKGFRSRVSGYQEVITMGLALPRPGTADNQESR